MDPNTRALMMGAAGAGGAEKIYVEDVFSTYLYTGNGSTQTITNGIDLSGKGGLVWYKSRNNAVDNALFDTARGAGNILLSNTTDAQGTGYAQSFTSSGFSLTNGGTFYNGNGYTYASWTFRKAPKFFDIVTFTSGTNTNRRISHSLGSVPGMIILKRTDGVGGWLTYHRSIGRDAYLEMNSTASTGGFTITNIWGTSDPTSTDFGIDETNLTGASRQFVGYVFAHDAGGFGDSGADNVVSCGTFSRTFGTANSVNLGYEPQWVLIKCTTQTDSWQLYDTMRGLSQTASLKLEPNSSNSETDTAGMILTATGFDITATGVGGGTFIYIAIRRGPMKTPTDPTKVFELKNLDNASSGDLISNTVIPDMALHLHDLGARYVVSRLTGGINTASSSASSPRRWLTTNNTAAEDTSTTGLYYNMQNSSFNVAGNGADPGSSFNLSYFFRRAPGFFDVVAYTGTGSATTVSHNLGVTPELMIVKRRDSTSSVGWISYVASLGNQARIQLNLSDAATTGSTTIWNSTSPTGSVFTVGAATDINGSGGTYIAYLFASCPGVSKVGSYTGTGTTLQINCGFTAGARFVMIKRTDDTGDWYVWDTARGIVSGNDPYLLLNSTAAEVTGTDYIDPLSSGFEISSSAPAAINASGGSFIFLAVA